MRINRSGLSSRLSDQVRQPSLSLELKLIRPHSLNHHHVRAGCRDGHPFKLERLLILSDVSHYFSFF